MSMEKQERGVETQQAPTVSDGLAVNEAGALVSTESKTEKEKTIAELRNEIEQIRLAESKHKDALLKGIPYIVS